MGIDHSLTSSKQSILGRENEWHKAKGKIPLPPGYSRALLSETGCMEMPVSQDLRSTIKTFSTRFLSKNGAESLFDGFSGLSSWPCLAPTSTGHALRYHEDNKDLVSWNSLISAYA
ncbi:hypothetical protein JHK84_028318 [Glycine max]|nr:hypothetical protein JHK84_028318 [Glycine max]